MNKGLDPTEAQIATLFNTAQFLLANSNLPIVIKAKEKNKAAFQFVEDNNFISYNNLRAKCFPDENIWEPGNENTWEPVNGTDNFDLANIGSTGAGFEQLVSLKFLINRDYSDVYYKHLLELRAKLKICLKKAKSQSSKDRIGYLMLSIDKGIGE